MSIGVASGAVRPILGGYEHTDLNLRQIRCRTGRVVAGTVALMAEHAVTVAVYLIAAGTIDIACPCRAQARTRPRNPLAGIHEVFLPLLGTCVEQPKTESGKRVIYMTDSVRDALLAVMVSRPKAKPLRVDGLSSFIFLNRNGLPRTGADYDRVFRGIRAKYGKKGGIIALPSDLTPHSLRHTFCTDMAKKGMNPKALQYIMGHKDIKMTLGYYSHMDGESAAEEMQRLAA